MAPGSHSPSAPRSWAPPTFAPMWPTPTAAGSLILRIIFHPKSILCGPQHIINWTIRAPGCFSGPPTSATASIFTTSIWPPWPALWRCFPSPGKPMPFTSTMAAILSASPPSAAKSPFILNTAGAGGSRNHAISRGFTAPSWEATLRKSWISTRCRATRT